MNHMYPNAHNGIKKIYLGEILSLIAVIVGGIAGVAAIIGYKLSEAGTEGIGASAAFVGGGIVVIIAGILAFVAFILNILGISNASVDERADFIAVVMWYVDVVALAFDADTHAAECVGDDAEVFVRNIFDGDITAGHGGHTYE